MLHVLASKAHFQQAARHLAPLDLLSSPDLRLRIFSNLFIIEGTLGVEFRRSPGFLDREGAQQDAEAEDAWIFRRVDSQSGRFAERPGDACLEDGIDRPPRRPPLRRLQKLTLKNSPSEPSAHSTSADILLE